MNKSSYDNDSPISITVTLLFFEEVFLSQNLMKITYVLTMLTHTTPDHKQEPGLPATLHLRQDHSADV